MLTCSGRLCSCQQSYFYIVCSERATTNNLMREQLVNQREQEGERRREQERERDREREREEQRHIQVLAALAGRPVESPPMVTMVKAEEDSQDSLRVRVPVESLSQLLRQILILK